MYFSFKKGHLENIWHFMYKVQSLVKKRRNQSYLKREILVKKTEW